MVGLRADGFLCEKDGGLRADGFLCEKDGRADGISFSKAEGGLRSALDSSAPRGAPLADPRVTLPLRGKRTRSPTMGSRRKRLANHETYKGFCIANPMVPFLLDCP